MSGPAEGSVRIVCTECRFERIVKNQAGRPADVIVTHGRESGHTVSIEGIPGGE